MSAKERCRVPGLMWWCAVAPYGWDWEENAHSKFLAKALQALPSLKQPGMFDVRGLHYRAIFTEPRLASAARSSPLLMMADRRQLARSATQRKEHRKTGQSEAPSDPSAAANRTHIREGRQRFRSYSHSFCNNNVLDTPDRVSPSRRRKEPTSD